MRSNPTAWSALVLAALLGCPGEPSRDAGVSTDSGPADAAARDQASAADHRTPVDSADSDRSLPDHTVLDSTAPDATVADATVADATAPDGAAPDHSAEDAGPPCSLPVTIRFSGEVVTVSGTPLGLDASARLTAVSGRFRYDRCVGDQDGRVNRGNYDHAGEESGLFEISIGALGVTGSTRPVVEIENLDPDTLRYRDGPQFLDPTPRTMAVDGSPSAELELMIAITDSSGAAFGSDALPDPFPFLDIASYPHTFSLSDAGGTLLLQLDSMSRDSD